MDRILLIEDDDALGAQVAESLRGAGFDVEWLRDGEVAKRAEVDRFGLVILDLMLPGVYGLDLLALWRKTSDVPVLVLSARQDASDKVRALKLGADDYVTKPFWPEELLARVRARLRRPDLVRGDGTTRVVGAIVIDAGKREVRVDGTIIELTKAELDVLEALARRAGSAVTRAALVNEALDPERGTERTLDVHISRLRKKLGSAGAQITTVWGIGYKLVSEVP